MYRINFIKDIERKEIIKYRKRKFAFSFGLFFIGLAGGLFYLIGIKKYKLFKW
jgi:hypothetical protein